MIRSRRHPVFESSKFHALVWILYFVFRKRMLAVHEYACECLYAYAQSYICMLVHLRDLLAASISEKHHRMEE